MRYFTVSTFKSPEIFAPAWIPVTEGKNMANMVKKLCSVPSIILYRGDQFSINIDPVKQFSIDYELLEINGDDSVYDLHVIPTNPCASFVASWGPMSVPTKKSTIAININAIKKFWACKRKVDASTSSNKNYYSLFVRIYLGFPLDSNSADQYHNKNGDNADQTNRI